MINIKKLAEILSYETNFNLKESEYIIRKILSCMIKTLQGGENIELRGFGNFIIVERKSLIRKHPVTGEIIKIPTQKILKFIPGKELKKIKEIFTE